MSHPGAEFCEEFFSHPAISFEHQPDLKRLFETLTDTDDRFTIVVGAGVSLDAGLPSWPKLIDNIIAAIGDEAWERESRLDETDLQRKAEYVIQLAMESSASTSEGVVLNALYRKESGGSGSARHPQPGRLADAIARLCAWLGNRVDIVTTNFDVLLESALERYTESRVESVPFDTGIDDSLWTGGKGVLHLHGILVPNRGHQGNIVLTESDFLRYGPDVRQFMLNQIKETHMVFVGVSMTDPNLVAPLWEFANPRKSASAAASASLPSKCFMLSVATPNTSSPNAIESASFAIKRANYLRDSLGVKTIFFKSYGQQSQAICEASLALLDADNYRSDDPNTSSRYGFRFTRALEASYRNVGCPPSEEMPTGIAADQLSERLHRHLHDGGGPIQTVIRQARSRTQRVSHKAAFEAHQPHFADEEFGLFLWLRSQSEDNDAYDLHLVGSSAYRHREAWSLDRKADISAKSRFPVGRASFRGQADISDFPVKPTWQLWGSTYAVPFSFYLDTSSFMYSENGAAFDSVEVGVIALQSTHFTSDSDAEWSQKRKRSILSTLTEQAESALVEALAGIAREIVTVPVSPPA